MQSALVHSLVMKLSHIHVENIRLGVFVWMLNEEENGLITPGNPSGIIVTSLLRERSMGFLYKNGL